MNALRNNKSFSSQERGSALLAALCLASVMALVLSSYLAMCYQTLKTSNRGEQSTHGIELAETGMENAIWALNKNDWTGWTVNSTTKIATRTMTGSDFNYANGATGSIAITVTAYDTAPIVKSVGTVTLANGTSVSRALKTQTALTKAPLFTNALSANVSSGIVNLHSGGSLIDSYDSSLGFYNASTNSGYSAIVTGSSVTMANSTQIKGYVATPPTSSGGVLLTYGSTSQVTGPTTSASVKIDPTRQSTSRYQPFFDIVTPTGAGTALAAPTGTVNIGTAGGAVTTYYATLDGNGLFDIENSGALVVNGPVKLVVNGNFYVGAYSGSGSVTVTATGSLEVFVSGYTYIAGGGIINQQVTVGGVTKYDPSKVAIYGTSSSTGYYCLVYSTTPFRGVVYAPNADVFLYGASNASGFYGSFIGRNVHSYPYDASPLGIHYDKALRTAVFSGLDTPYAIPAGSLTETTP